MVVPDGGDRNAPVNPFYNTKKESERSGGAGRRHAATRSQGGILEILPSGLFRRLLTAIGLSDVASRLVVSGGARVWFTQRLVSPPPDSNRSVGCGQWAGRIGRGEGMVWDDTKKDIYGLSVVASRLLVSGGVRV